MHVQSSHVLTPPSFKQIRLPWLSLSLQVCRQAACLHGLAVRFLLFGCLRLTQKGRKVAASVADGSLPAGTMLATTFTETLTAAAGGSPVTFHTPQADEDLSAAAEESEAPLQDLFGPAALVPAPAAIAFAPTLAPGLAPGQAPGQAPGAAPGPSPAEGAVEESAQGLGGGNGAGGGDNAGGGNGDEGEGGVDGDAGVNSSQTNSRDGGSSGVPLRLCCDFGALYRVPASCVHRPSPMPGSVV